MNKGFCFFCFAMFICFGRSFGQVKKSLQITGFKKNGDILNVYTSNGLLQIIPYSDKTVQIKFGNNDSLKDVKNYGVVNLPKSFVRLDVRDAGNNIVAASAFFSVQINKADAHLSFYDEKGNCVIKEADDFDRATTSNDIKEKFKLTSNEALYGLGQYRDNLLNLRGTTREMVQFNTQVTIPVVLSTNGWGIFWDNPSRSVFKDDASGMSFSSDRGNGVNFFLFFGNRLDSIVAQYRQLTGDAPLMPEWALGYHQSRNRYASQKELLDVTRKMRDEKIPMNSIFIDYFFWGKYGMGSHHFDEAQYPEPKKMIDTLHRYHTKVIVTVWPAFDSGSNNYRIMKDNNFLLKGGTVFNGAEIYDPFNPRAAAMYWKLANDSLVSLGIDGWFLDGPEPDQVGSFLKTKTYIGAAADIQNLYPLYHTSNFYKGLLQARLNERPYIITRSGWASQQHYGTVVWSGDIQPTFAELKRQIVAGLNYTASGLPYWTTDVGGYDGGDPYDEGYRNLYVRWWQYGVFCPIFRSHGHRQHGKDGGISNELWAYGKNVQQICTGYDNLRYRLLPYIYSLAWAVTDKQYTPMRLLSFDFPDDSLVHNIKDEFMYGPAFLVCPVTDSNAVARSIYLPKGATWADFWSGKILTGGQTVHADAPIDKIPLFIKTGSIIPFGPKMQYVQEKPESPIELRVYSGADGKFSLYEDDGSTFDYKKGARSVINFTWNNSTKTLTIGKRNGAFPGMTKTRVFHVVSVRPNAGTGIDDEGVYDKTITYDGNEIKVKL